MGEKIPMSWNMLVFRVKGGLALVLWLMAGRPLPENLSMNWGDLWDALLLVRREPWGDQIRDRVLELLLQKAEGFDEYKRISHIADGCSEVFDRTIVEMTAKANDFDKLTDLYNTILTYAVSKGEDERIPVILKRMADLPNRDFKVTAEILKRTADEKIAAKLRRELGLKSLNFEQLRDLISTLPDDPVAQKAIRLASELAETFNELRLLVHSAIRLGRSDIKAKALSRMSRRSDVDLNGILNLFGYDGWSKDEECVNFVIQWIDQRAKKFSEWHSLSNHNYPEKLESHALSEMLELASAPDELCRCLQAHASNSNYKKRVLERMLQLI